MKHYILINKKIAKTTLTNLATNKKATESLNSFKKMCFINSFSFRPGSVEAIGWYGGNNQEDAIKILDIVPSEISWYTYNGKDKVFKQVDSKATEEDNYYCLPFNNPGETKGIIKILENKKYSNIYLVIKYKSSQLNTSSNTSINLSSESIDTPNEGLVGLFRSQEEEKKKLENIIAEQQEKLNVLNNYVEKQQVEFKQNLDDLKNHLLKDKEQVVTQLKHEIDIRRETIDQHGKEINRLNICLQNEQSEVNRQKGLVVEIEKKANFYDSELKAERLKVGNLQNEVNQYKELATERQNKVSTLENQLNNTIFDRNNWQGQFMREQVKVNNLTNEKNNLQNQVNNLTNQNNILNQKLIQANQIIISLKQNPSVKVVKDFF